MTYSEDRQRVASLIERTGKPHLHIYRGSGNSLGNLRGWLWRGVAMPGTTIDEYWHFCDHLDEVYGYE